MRFRLLAAASAPVFAAISVPAGAQAMQMPGMAMPTPASRAPEKPAPKATSRSPDAGQAPLSASVQAAPAMTMLADHSQMDQMPMQDSQPPMAGMADHMGHGGMAAAFGTYPGTREASGTAWQPDSSEHAALHGMVDGWMLMLHGSLALTADSQGGRRGDDKLFVGGHLMGSARRVFGKDTLQFRAILSPEPLMGAEGYPLLLASGETANGRDRLIDRQHPHDFIGELSASWSHRLSRTDSIFLYAGLPGEPAFGPPAYLHREAIMDSPEAPITHHWLDSTHVSEGVVTAGFVHDRVKIEISRFNGREPNQHRWDIETGPLDSTAVRFSWNPTRTLALQTSWTRLVDPEQLEPGINQTRWSTSALYAADIAKGWRLAATAAVGRRIQEGHGDNAAAIEAALKHDEWTLFGRGELTENRELVDLNDGPAFRVGKLSVGAIRDFQVAGHLALGLGGLVAVNFVPNGLAPLYGGRNPTGAMGFMRVKLN